MSAFVDDISGADKEEDSLGQECCYNKNSWPTCSTHMIQNMYQSVISMKTIYFTKPITNSWDSVITQIYDNPSNSCNMNK